MVHHRVRPIFSSAFFLAAAVVLALVWIGGATAEEPKQGEPKQGDAKKAEEKIPPLASDEEAAEALKVFKVEFKAKGIKGEEKIGAKAWAMTTLSQVQHPKVVDELVDQVTAGWKESLPLDAP